VEKEGSSTSGSGAERRGVRCRRLLQISGRMGSAEREMWGSVQACHVAKGEREKEGGGAGRQLEAAARAHGGGGLANKGRRWGVGDAARLTGRAGRQRGPVSATGCGRERGK
jgi:hypothetical protein